MIAAAILDRLLHHSTTIRGDSYLLKEKKRVGLITTMGGDGEIKASKGGQFSTGIDTSAPQPFS